jgi:hypothetical protein
MRKASTSIAILFSLLLLPLSAWALKLPDAVPKPTATLKSFDIEAISLRDIDFVFNFDIANPYPVALKLDEVKFTCFIEQNQLFSTSTGQGLSIKARNSAVNAFKLNLKYADVIKIIKDYANKDLLACRIDVSIVIPLPKMPALPKNITFDYSVDTQVPAIKPTVSIANFKVKKPSPDEIKAALKKKGSSVKSADVVAMFSDIVSGKTPKKVIDPASLDIPIDVDFDIVLKNDTRYKLLFKDLDYTFMVQGEKLVTGVTKDIANGGDASTLRVSNRFSSKALSKTLLAFFDQGTGNFALQGTTYLKVPDAVKKDPLKLQFDEKGDFRTE